ncbi:MAG: phosphoribosylanthranilate isomerase [Candidatus Kariarchaeaceae archaeon]|jgi:phosphoribosylanthranilate isomerase
MYRPRVKICCINSIEELNLAVSYGANAIGLVSEMPSGPGVISDELIRQLASLTPPGVASFLLISKQDVTSIIQQQQSCGTNTLQLVDDLKKGNHQELIEALPGISIVQVLHVNDEEAIDKAKQLENEVSAILLDSGNQKLDVKELGGTGRTHDWSISKRIVETISTPVFLAGGLNPDNISLAIKEVEPYGLDMCSGVRSNGNLDKDKLMTIFRTLYNLYD